MVEWGIKRRGRYWKWLVDRSSRIRGEGPTVNNLKSILLSKVVDAKRATLQSQVIRWREARRPKSDGTAQGLPCMESLVVSAAA